MIFNQIYNNLLIILIKLYFKEKMKLSKTYIYTSSSLLYILILISSIHFNNCECSINEPFKLPDGSCATDCDNSQLFQDKTCIPISTKESVTAMFNKIVSYYASSINVNSITNSITLEGENINYIITTNIIENSNTNSYLLKLGENCLNALTSEFYIVLINIKNNNYITTSKGIRLFDNTNQIYDLNTICNKQTINIGVPISITNEEKALYKQIKSDYGYDLFNINDEFYTDKCSKFTTSDKTDISLQRRNEIYGNKFANIACSNICTYQKFNIDENKVYCNCVLGEEKKEKNKIEKSYFNYKIIKCFKKIGKDFKKNYLLFIMGILCFLFLLCFIITCIRLSSTVSKYVESFTNLKNIFVEYYQKYSKKETRPTKPKGKKEVKRISKFNEINKNENNITEKQEEEEEEGENEDEKEEKSNESGKTNIKQNDNKNNNIMNNPYQNYYMNNAYAPYNNPYLQYQQYQQYQYQLYNQYIINYMQNLKNQNNRNENEEDEEEEDEEGEEEEDDIEEEDEVDNEDKKEDEAKNENKNENNRIKKINNSKFPLFKDIDENLVYKIKLDYNKVKEYSRFLKMQKEKAKNEEIKNNQENETKNDNKKNINENKSPDKPIKKRNKKPKEKERNKSKLKDDLKKKKKNKENNSIEIFKKKELKNDLDDIKKKKKRSKSKDNKNIIDIIKHNKKEILNMNKKHLPNINNKNINHNKNKSKNKKRSSTKDKIDILNNKPNPPKNSITSDRSNSELKLISQQQNSEKNSEINNNINSENKGEENNEENKEDILVENISKKQEKEKEQKIYGLNLQSNGDNSTVDNILIKSKYFNGEKLSSKNQISNSTQYEINKSSEIKFGSNDFYKKLKVMPEYKRKEFFANSELNFLEYEHSYDCDTRAFSEIYSSIIKEENNIIFSLSYCADDYNLSFAKFSFLILQLILYLTVICFFFGDDTLNNIYDKKNKFDFAYMILPMLFTFLICLVINIPLRILIKSNNNVLDIKYENKTFEKGKTIIRIKIFFYFFIGFIIMTCGFFLVSIFSSVYTNSQIKLITCAGYTILGNFVLQIIYCFFIASLRICSLTSEEIGRASCRERV